MPPSIPNPFDPASWPRLFTPAEATALLPTLRPLLERLQRRKATLDRDRRKLAALSPAMRGNGHAAEAMALEQRIDACARDVAEGIREIAGHGVELKDIDRGLVDFPSLREGRVVYLCWLLEEERVGWWHEVEAGIAGRQPLEG